MRASRFAVCAQLSPAAGNWNAAGGRLANEEGPGRDKGGRLREREPHDRCVSNLSPRPPSVIESSPSRRGSHCAARPAVPGNFLLSLLPASASVHSEILRDSSRQDPFTLRSKVPSRSLVPN